MTERNRPPSFDDLDARLRKARARKSGPRRSDQVADASGRTARGQGLTLALRIGTELVAGIAVGVVIGLLLDWWLDTKPLFMIVFFLLGASAGMMNVYRTMSGIGHGVGYKPPKEGGDDKDGGAQN